MPLYLPEESSGFSLSFFSSPSSFVSSVSIVSYATLRKIKVHRINQIAWIIIIYLGAFSTFSSGWGRLSDCSYKEIFSVEMSIYEPM